jgi:hypothetical protein
LIQFGRWPRGKLLDRLRRADLLVVDELGYLPIDGRRANLFFQMVAARYTKGAIIITGNVSFDGWEGLRRRRDRLSDPGPAPASEPYLRDQWAATGSRASSLPLPSQQGEGTSGDAQGWRREPISRR